MNVLRIVPATAGALAYREIEIDAKRLAHHFVGRLGAHPGLLSPLGWTSAAPEYRSNLVLQLLGEASSELESGRVPVLVCEMCGDVGCGAIAVRIAREGGRVRWTDWADENGYEPASATSWPICPDAFVFEALDYDRALRAEL